MGEAILPEDGGKTLHEGLLRGDVTAPARIAETYLPALVKRLTHRFPNLHDAHLITTAAEDALLTYIGRPEQYDPTRLPLEHYLWLSAKFDLFNLLAKNKRESLPDSIRGFVELDDPTKEYSIEDSESLTVEERVEILTSPVWGVLRDLIPDPKDLELVAFMMEGVRQSEEYSKVLGITYLPFEEQAAIVKRHKDRLKKMLQRKLDPEELRTDG